MYGILDKDLKLNADLFSDDNPKTQALRQKTNFNESDKNVDFNLEEFQMRAGHKMSEMLKNCKWRDMKCSADDFKPVCTFSRFPHRKSVNRN